VIALAELVVDSSVVVKWYVPELGAIAARSILGSVPTLAAPDMLVAEFGNVIWKKVQRGELSPVDGESIIQAFVASNDCVLYSSASLLVSAFDIANDLRHSVYDALYLALAERLGCQLVTGDLRLARAVSGTRFASLVRVLTGP
jgi:predicted nucleic acid-binding protein